MKRVITYGTFDIMHVGHIRLLKRAKELGDYLIVAVSTDDFNHLKGKKSTMAFEERVEILEAIKYVDKVIPENTWEQKESDIKEFDVDTFVIGDDWKGKFDFLKSSCQVVYLPRTESISSTQVKDLIREKK